VALLEVRALSRRFGGLMAVNRLDLRVERGEILGGGLPPTHGTISFKGERLERLSPHQVVQRGLVRTHQLARPFGNLSVLGNVLVGASFGHRDRHGREPRQEAIRVLELTGLLGRADLPARVLTLPDRKRLEIARALAARPELLLLDEVAAGLNPSELAEAMSLLRKIRDDGTTLLFTEHVIKAVMELSDRVVVVDHGEKIAEGEPHAIVSDPAVIEAYLGTHRK
jgi:branched-chain amino acid transport system ATP-binding protein